MNIFVISILKKRIKTNKIQKQQKKIKIVFILQNNIFIHFHFLFLHSFFL